MTTPTQIRSAGHINDLAQVIHQIAAEHGFWEVNDGERNFAEMMMLATSELVEAMEEHREGRIGLWYSHDKHCANAPGKPHPGPYGSPGACCVPKPEGAIIEVIDGLIRLLDTADNMVQNLTAGGDPRTIIDYMHLKMQYNNNREHMHGKAY